MKKAFILTMLMALIAGNAMAALSGYQGTMVTGVGMFVVYDSSVSSNTGNVVNLDENGVVTMANTLLANGPSAYGWNFVYVPFVHKNGNGEYVIDLYSLNSNKELTKLNGVTVPLPSSYPAAACVDGGTLNGKQVCQLKGDISQSERLTSDKYWELVGKVTVGAGATLEIEAGTTVFGNKFDSTLRDYLVISQGAKIKAIGTKNAPIVFTGRQALDGTDTEGTGQWGGVIVAGYAPTNQGGDAVFEADPDIHYGGNSADDNSGVMKYVIIRNGGAEIAPDEEINGLTLCGVGRGTSIDYVEIYRNYDDGVEFFGGTVNLKHVVLIGNEDDNLDTDQGYNGHIQYAYIKQTVVSSKDPRGIEADNLGANNDATPRSSVVVANMTIENAVPSTADVQPHEAIMLRRGTDYHIMNAVVKGARPDNCIEVRNDATWTAISDTTDTLPTFAGVALEGTCDSDGDGNPDYFHAKDNTIYTTDDIAALYNGEGAYSSISTGNTLNSVTGTPVNPASYDSFFDAATFMGAYDPANDWRQGWTVGL